MTKVSAKPTRVRLSLTLHCTPAGAWAIGAQIIFSLTPNSAAAERIFSQTKDMFGANQASALADMLQASMMLRYHKRLAPNMD